MGHLAVMGGVSPPLARGSVFVTLWFCGVFVTGWDRESKQALLFLKKRSKKLLLVLGRGWLNPRGLNYKSFFCFFFVHKKEDSSFLSLTD
jgi:hypothetical protein